MKNTFFALITVCSVLQLRAQQSTASLMLEGFNPLRNICAYQNGTCAVLSGSKELKIHIYAPGESDFKTIHLNKEGGYSSFLNTGPNSEYMYVAVAKGDDKPTEKNENFNYEILRVNPDGSTQVTGTVKRVFYDYFYLTATAVTEKAFYCVYWRLVRDDKGKSANFFTEFTVYKVLHESNELKSYKIYIPTAEDQTCAAFDGIRNESVYFHYARRDEAKLTTAVWCWNEDNELSQIFTITTNDAQKVSPGRAVKESFGGSYRDFTGWTADARPTNGALVQITPDPFSTGFYVFKYYQKEIENPKFMIGKECTGYSMEYYSSNGKKIWGKTQPLTPEMEEEAAFKRPMTNQRCAKIIPLDSGILRLVLYTYSGAFPILIKNRKWDEVESHKVPTGVMTNAFAFPDQYAPYVSMFLSAGEVTGNYADYVEEITKGRDMNITAIATTGYHHLISFDEKLKELKFTTFESPYKAIPPNYLE